ncbi:hypothetical protein EWB00_000121 [Schistosoma japonicum]|uniref:Uncharacterized protein n=1 Tax=Schistosoma japonicum TaxID=6182 RepID=A0A4Z2CL40_SCHJA|nr:hypothetical protein EWB00_000121 [Schistosoma japonicum]
MLLPAHPPGPPSGPTDDGPSLRLGVLWRKVSRPLSTQKRGSVEKLPGAQQVRGLASWATSICCCQQSGWAGMLPGRHGNLMASAKALQYVGGQAPGTS